VVQDAEIRRKSVKVLLAGYFDGISAILP